MKEIIYDVFWEGPFNWENRNKQLKRNHVLYAIYGSHHLYGRDVLLYIGKTSGRITGRLAEHDSWIADEYDDVTVRLASVGIFTSWEKWSSKKGYPKARSTAVDGIETLLIYSHQPSYNIHGKSGVRLLSKGIRIFNTGKLGHLLPEVSYFYYSEG